MTKHDGLTGKAGYKMKRPIYNIKKYIGNINIKNIKKIAVWISVVVLIFVIYIFSGQEGALSHKLSKGIIREVRVFLELPGFLRQFKADFGLSYDTLLRKTAHFILFFVLCLLLYAAFKYSIKRKAALLALAASVLAAGMDEYHQVFVSGRTARITDIIIDTAGAVFALTVIFIFNKIVAEIFKRRCV